MAPNFTAYNSYAPVAAATALLRREPLSFVAYELAVRLEHVEVSLKLAGEPMNTLVNLRLHTLLIFVGDKSGDKTPGRSDDTGDTGDEGYRLQR